MRLSGWKASAVALVISPVVLRPALAEVNPAVPGAAQAVEQGQTLVLFDFENSLEEWGIPDWALSSKDHVGKSLSGSVDFVSRGKGSLQLLADFAAGKWTGAYIERMMYVTDWISYDAIAVDVYLPYNAPKGLKARIILTVGEDWKWTEMNRGIDLMPDQWTTITANLKPGSMDWKFFPDESFRKDIRKIGIRIESDGQAYTGAIYLDQVRLLALSP